SRIKRKIKAETFLAIGKVTTKKIITPQLNNQIRKFLDRFKENLEKNTLNKMYYYFSEKKLDNYNPDFYIDKILDYEIELTNSIYKLWVFFESKENKRDSFFIRFFIDKNNYLKIKTPPQRPEKHIVISTDSEEGRKLLKLINDYPENKEGFYDIPTGQLEDIINKLEEKKKMEKIRNRNKSSLP
ncbi:MAG: hypothetical protein H8E57_10075, partial [Candidatus Cloacimonetes bacterium]|nr:hypothetical protein [Candidatus Cloacimonadota bacterium]